ncbi:sensor histidine kinase [Marinospirillum sp.]|uniref:sensor histidine kinase n=1 Tax=Marinospirillum sp. TaxID=2183934 RepID=UPI003A862C1E
MRQGSLICLVWMLCFGAGVAQAAPAQLHLGVLSWTDAPTSSWTTTLHALQAEFPQIEWVLEPLSLAEIEHALAAGRLDYLLTNPGHFVTLTPHFELAPLATFRAPGIHQRTQAVGSALVVRAEDSHLQHWQDLAMARIAAVEPAAFGGFQLIWDALEHQGLDREQDVGEWVFTGFPMEGLLPLLTSGEVDAIVLRSCLLEQLAAQGQIDMQAFRVLKAQPLEGYPCLTSTPLYPDWPFLSTGRAPTEVTDQVLMALLQMQDAATGDRLWSAAASYQSVYALFERLRVGPFAAFPRNPLQALLVEYRVWIFSFALVLLIIFAHHFWIEWLVRQRTRALEIMLEEQRRTQARLRQQERELQHLSRYALMGELTAGLAHELNQPLAAIVNYARGAERLLATAVTDQPSPMATEQQAALHQVAQRIALQAEQAAARIKSLRLFLRRGETQKQPFTLGSLLDQAQELIAIQAEQQGVTVTWSCSDALRAQSLYADPVQLLQVLLNLFTNALDALVEAEHKQIEVQAQREASYLLISVTDHGCGLQDPARLFEPFYTTKADGMGLGLSLSRTLIQAHQGELSVCPSPTGGVVASIRLPLPPHSSCINQEKAFDGDVSAPHLPSN